MEYENSTQMPVPVFLYNLAIRRTQCVCHICDNTVLQFPLYVITVAEKKFVSCSHYMHIISGKCYYKKNQSRGNLLHHFYDVLFVEIYIKRWWFALELSHGEICNERSRLYPNVSWNIIHLMRTNKWHDVQNSSENNR